MNKFYRVTMRPVDKGESKTFGKVFTKSKEKAEEWGFRCIRRMEKNRKKQESIEDLKKKWKASAVAVDPLTDKEIPDAKTKVDSNESASEGREDPHSSADPGSIE